ncbi:MAG: acetate/propionate family kinase [Actinomycetota bacterium]|nr:acetate/propionate family kinase [Actinomycetota bacterium]
MRVLVVNTGSSTLKLRLVADDDTVAASDDVDPWDGDADPAVLAPFREALAQADAVGHRVVHGGASLREATRIDAGVLAEIEALTPLAPLHQPRAVAAIRAVDAAAPGLPAVACFDTAFHASLPAAAATYALPREWIERWSLRRYGFHGLSHGYAARRGAELVGGGASRIVSCHLGAGASLCAVRDGRSVDTTMGFTPLEGLVMATRSGSVDPGLVLWLLTEAGLDPVEVTTALEKRSGLAGLTGTTGDMRAVLAAGDGTAVDVYVHRLRREIAAMVAALDGLDLLVFTGGVGEHAPAIRAAAAGGLGFLGVAVDDGRNAATTTDGDVTAAGAAVRTVVVTAREDLEVARQVRGLLG